MTGINHTGRSTDDPTDDSSTDRDLRALLDGALARLDRLEQQADALAEERDDLQQTVAEQAERIDHLEERVAEVDERTRLLDIVDNIDQADADQRSMVLLQHLHRKARKTDGMIKMDTDDAERVLHYPEDVHRTSYYGDLRRIQDWVNNEDVCHYDAGVLTFDLRGVELDVRDPSAEQVVEVVNTGVSE